MIDVLHKNTSGCRKGFTTTAVAFQQRRNEIKTGDTNSYLLDVSAHKPGIYFLTVYTNSGKVIKKIIKQ